MLDGADQTFTIAPNVGYSDLGRYSRWLCHRALSAATRSRLSRPTHTISATFAVVPQHTISGRVTDKATGAGIAGATVYFSTTPNAFVSSV